MLQQHMCDSHCSHQAAWNVTDKLCWYVRKSDLSACCMLQAENMPLQLLMSMFAVAVWAGPLPILCCCCQMLCECTGTVSLSCKACFVVNILLVRRHSRWMVSCTLTNGRHTLVGSLPAAEAASAAVTFEFPGLLGSAPPCSRASRVAVLPDPAAHMTGEPASHAALASAPWSRSSFTTATLPAALTDVYASWLLQCSGMVACSVSVTRHTSVP